MGRCLRTWRLGAGAAGMVLIASCGGESKRLGEGASEPGVAGAAGEAFTGQAAAGPVAAGGGLAAGGRASTAGGRVSVPGAAGALGGGVPAPLSGAGGVAVTPSPLAGMTSFGGTLATGGAAPGPGNGGSGAVPDGCEVTLEADVSGRCESHYDCGGEYVASRCDPMSGDTWLCSCLGPVNAGSYTFRGASGGELCNRAALFCALDEPVVVGERTCSVESEAPGQASCNLSAGCTSPVATESGVQVGEVSDTRIIDCFEAETGGLQCDCNEVGLGTRQDFMYFEGDANLACSRVLDACVAPEAMFTTPAECDVQLQSADATECQHFEICVRRAEFDDGVVLEHNLPRGASCNRSDAAGSYCGCTQGVRQIGFALEKPVELATCELSLEACAEPGRIEVEGPMECAPGTQSVQSIDCTTEFTCTQTARLGSESITLTGGLTGRCKRPIAGEPWRCACESFGEVGYFDVDTDDGWEACTEAAERCPALVDVKVGYQTTLEEAND